LPADAIANVNGDSNYVRIQTMCERGGMANATIIERL
jgi:hypothetical protein